MRIILILALPLALFGQESVHSKGPNGLEAWTVSKTVPTLEGQGPLPTRMVIARNGKTLRSVTGDPFLWTFVFEDAGKHIAYQTGPLHFAMTCVLMDIATGKELGTYDCFDSEKMDRAPVWVRTLVDKPD